jgi:hypothetical protein
LTIFNYKELYTTNKFASNHDTDAWCNWCPGIWTYQKRFDTPQVFDIFITIVRWIMSIVRFFHSSTEMSFGDC